MKQLALAFCLLVSTARVAFAQATPTPATFNPIPQQNESFFTTLYNFLVGEAADRDATWESDFTLDSDLCVHGTAVGMTGSFSFTCQAMVEGDYIVDPLASINYATYGATASDFCWVILTPQVNTTESGFSRVGTSHYMVNCSAPGSSRPTLNGPGMYVMGVTISGSAITSVLVAAPSYAALFRYTNISELAGNTIAGRIYIPDTGNPCITDAGGSCTPFATGDTAGCATCGDSATGFFSTGLLAAARGGTGRDTSAAVGVPQLGPTPGAWSVPTAVAVRHGGTGKDLSAVGGSALVEKTPGVITTQFFPTTLLRQFAALWGVDGTLCTKDDTNATFVTNIIGSIVTCADDGSARFGGEVSLPSSLEANTSVNVTLTSVNQSSNSGVFGVDFTCVCVGDGAVLTPSNFPTALNLDTTYTGTPGENEQTSGVITCGGTCQPDDNLYWRATVDSTATTMPTPTNVKLGELSIEVQNIELSN